MIELFFEIILPFVLELISWIWIDRYAGDRQSVISEDFKKLIGIPALAGILGAAFGCLSTVVSSRYWIEDESLQVVFLLVAPLIAGTLLWGWVRFRRRETWQGQIVVFACGMLFLFGYLLARTALCRWK